MNFIAKGRQKRIIVKYKWGDKMQKNTFNIGCIFLRCVLCALFALTDISAHAADTCSILDNSQCNDSTPEYNNSSINCKWGEARCVNFSGTILRTQDCNFCQEGYYLSRVDCGASSFRLCISCESVDNSKYCPGSEFYGASDCPENGKCSNGIFTGCNQGYKWDVDNWNNSSCTLCETDEYCPGGKSGAFTCPDEDSITLGDDEGEIEPHSTINQEGCYKPDGSPDYPGYLGYSFNNTEYSIQYCNACLPGYYDDGTDADIIIPSAMQFSEGALVCPVTKAQALNCVQCGDGKYCPGYQGDATYDKNTKYTCPVGYYCEQGERFPCDEDQFCPAGSSKPQDCPTGSVCGGMTISRCEPGYYWADNENQGSTTTPCEPCTVGHYCPGGSGSDAGQFSCDQATDGSGSVPCCLRDVLAAPIYIGRNVSNTKCPAVETDFDCDDEFPIFGTEVRTGNNSYYICSACDSGYVCDENGVNTGCANGYYDNDTSDEVVNCVPCNDDNNVVTIQGNPYYKNGAYCTNSERHLCSSELSKGYPDMKDEFYASNDDAKSRSECFVHFETGKNYADKDGVFTVLEEKIIGIEQCE